MTDTNTDTWLRKNRVGVAVFVVLLLWFLLVRYSSVRSDYLERYETCKHALEVDKARFHGASLEALRYGDEGRARELAEEYADERERDYPKGNDAAARGCRDAIEGRYPDPKASQHMFKECSWTRWSCEPRE